MTQDKTIEDLKFHQQTVATDSNAPLHLIHEKELEISGRMLTAKRQADEIVANARKKASDMVAAAESEGGAGAREHRTRILEQAETEVADLKAKSAEQVAQIEQSSRDRLDAAVRLIVEAVTTV